MRLLYIAWLKAAQHDEALDLDDEGYPLSDEDADVDLANPHEPPVPPGLQSLTASLQHYMAVFGIDADLVAAAAEASASATAHADQFAQWVSLLPEAERNAFLVRIAQDDSAARPELIRRLREVSGVATGSSASTAPRRTLQELLDRASDHARQRKAREQQAAAQARQRELDALAPREDALWEEVVPMIEQKNASGYERATKLLVDLRDLARRQRQQATFEARLDKIVTTYANRSALLRRLRKAGLA
jgi:DNA primase